MSARRASAAGVATLALALSQAAGVCVCEQGQGVRKAVPGDDPHDPRVDPQAPPVSKESVIWDFRKHGEPPLLSLWPRDPTAPGRKKHDAKVTKQGTRRLDVDTKWMSQIGVDAAKDVMTLTDYHRLRNHLEDKVIKVRRPAAEFAEKILSK